MSDHSPTPAPQPTAKTCDYIVDIAFWKACGVQAATRRDTGGTWVNLCGEHAVAYDSVAPAAPQEGTTPPEIDTVALRRRAAELDRTDWPGGPAGVSLIEDAADEIDRLRAAFGHLIRAAEAFCAELQEDADAVPQDELRRLHASLNVAGGFGLIEARATLAPLTSSQTDSSLRAVELTPAETETREALREAEAYIAALRMPLLDHFGTTDPELLSEVWSEQFRASSPTVTPPQTPTPCPSCQAPKLSTLGTIIVCLACKQSYAPEPTVLRDANKVSAELDEEIVRRRAARSTPTEEKTHGT